MGFRFLLDIYAHFATKYVTSLVYGTSPELETVQVQDWKSTESGTTHLKTMCSKLINQHSDVHIQGYFAHQ